MDSRALTFQGGDIPPSGCQIIYGLAFHGSTGHGHSSSQTSLRLDVTVNTVITVSMLDFLSGVTLLCR